MIEAPTSLEVTTLGRFTLRRDHDTLSGGNWNRRKVCDLFKLLLSAEQHRLHREQIQEVLWPSSSSEQAANSFGKTLYLLRRALEPELATGKGSSSTYVTLDHDVLMLVPASMRIDADLFEANAKQVQGRLRQRMSPQQQAGAIPPLLDEVDHVLAIYGGDYLPEDLYEDWASRKRDRLRHVYSLLLEQAAELAVTGGMGQRAIEYLRTLLEHNTADESVHRQLMLLYARMGRRREAVSQFQALRDVLREELRANPLPETIELYRTIQAGRISTDLAEALTMPLVKEKQSGNVSSTVQSEGQAPLSSTAHVHAHSPHDEHDEHSQHGHYSQQPAIAEEEEEGQQPGSQLNPERILNASLVGRGEELRRLQRAYSVSAQGQRRAVFVSGEAGIGKSRLARELAQWVTLTQHTPVLWGYCYEMTGSLPYQPVIDALSTHIRSCTPQQLQQMLGKSAVDLAKIAPELHAKLPELPRPEFFGPEVERSNLYAAVAKYFHALAAERALVLILDDVQWADTATLQLLSYLTAQSNNIVKPGAAAPLYVLLYRADEVHETHPLRGLLASLLRQGGADELRLKRLREEEVQQLLMNMAGHNVTVPFSDQIYKHTEGNPFFVGESIRVLIEEGKVKKVGERWQTMVALEDLALPPSVRMLIERRMVHLTPECRMTLAVAATLGRQFSSAVLCQARNLAEDVVAEHVDDAIRSQILLPLEATGGAARQEDDLIFTHDKIREVLAQWLNPLRRRAAHRQVAQALESHYAARLHLYYSKLAYHYQLAEDALKAVNYLLKAAEQAASVYAFLDAASYMEQAVDLLIRAEDRPLRAELLRRLSVEVYLYIGRPDKAVEAGIASCALWSELGDPLKEAEARLDVSFAFHWMGRESESISYIHRAFTCLEAVPDEIRLRAKAHAQWGLAATNAGDVPTALQQLELADALHAQVGGKDPFIGVVSLWARSWVSFLGGSLQKMLAYAQQSAELCREIRMYAWEPMMTYSAAWAQMMLGRLDEGTQTARDTLEKAQRHNAVGAQGWANLVMSFVAIHRGEWNEAALYADKAQEIAMLMSEQDLQARILWSRSLRASWLRDWEHAIEYALAALQLIEQDSGTSMAHPYLLLQAAKAYLFSRDTDMAQHYLDRAMELAQQRHYRQLTASAQRLQGRILHARGDFERAMPYFEQSLLALKALDDPVEYGRTQEAYGLFLLARQHEGDSERGNLLLAEARQTFATLGVKG